MKSSEAAMQWVDDQRFETMTMPHVNALFQTALRLTENPAGAQEVVREAYECAWKSFCRREEWSDWRLGLFKALMQRMHRHDRGWFDVSWSSESVETSEKYTPEPDDADAFSYSPGQVLSALTRVPVVFREVVLLIDCQEFSYQEAAAILSLSKDVVAERLGLGRRLLQSELNKAALAIA